MRAMPFALTAKNEGHMEYGIVSNTIMDTLADIGALGDLPKIQPGDVF